MNLQEANQKNEMLVEILLEVMTRGVTVPSDSEFFRNSSLRLADFDQTSTENSIRLILHSDPYNLAGIFQTEATYLVFQEAEKALPTVFQFKDAQVASGGGPINNDESWLIQKAFRTLDQLQHGRVIESSDGVYLGDSRSRVGDTFRQAEVLARLRSSLGTIVSSPIRVGPLFSNLVQPTTQFVAVPASGLVLRESEAGSENGDSHESVDDTEAILAELGIDGYQEWQVPNENRYISIALSFESEKRNLMNQAEVFHHFLVKLSGRLRAPLRLMINGMTGNSHDDFQSKVSQSVYDFESNLLNSWSQIREGEWQSKRLHGMDLASKSQFLRQCQFGIGPRGSGTVLASKLLKIPHILIVPPHLSIDTFGAWEGSTSKLFLEVHNTEGVVNAPNTSGFPAGQLISYTVKNDSWDSAVVEFIDHQKVNNS